MSVTVNVRGRGLFSGQDVTVALSRASGPSTIAVGGGIAVPLHLLAPAAGTRTSVLAGPGLRLSCVEHLFAAVGALAVGELRIDVDGGDELPLLDGGARAWAEALVSLELPSQPPLLRVVRAGRFELGASVYDFSPAADGARSCAVEYRGTHDDIEPSARWDGGADDFVDRIAPARTFVSEAEIAPMLEAGLAAHVAPESVVILGAAGPLAAGRPFSADEPARHKLLDLIGDLALHGGPPIGHVRAARPGHAATHVAVAQALASGVLAVAS